MESSQILHHPSCMESIPCEENTGFAISVSGKRQILVYERRRWRWLLRLVGGGYLHLHHPHALKLPSVASGPLDARLLMTMNRTLLSMSPIYTITSQSGWRRRLCTSLLPGAYCDLHNRIQRSNFLIHLKCIRPLSSHTKLCNRARIHYGGMQ